jgi:hypothetical protein
VREDTKVTDAHFVVVEPSRGPRERAINWRAVPYFLMVVAILFAARLIFDWGMRVTG